MAATRKVRERPLSGSYITTGSPIVAALVEGPPAVCRKKSSTIMSFGSLATARHAARSFGYRPSACR